MDHKEYIFVVYMMGYGEDVEAAYRNACEGFEEDNGETPAEITEDEAIRKGIDVCVDAAWEVQP